MAPRHRSFRTIAIAATALLAVGVAASAVLADPKPADPPKPPPAKQKKLLAAPKKPFVGQRLRAMPKQPPIGRKPSAAPKKPMASGPMEGGLEARLMRLEHKLDAVMRELHELRGELRHRPPAPPFARRGPGPGMRGTFDPPHGMHGRPSRGSHHQPDAQRPFVRGFPGPAAGHRPPQGPRPDGHHTGPPHSGHHGHHPGHAGPESKPKPPAGPFGAEAGPPKPAHKPGRPPGPPSKDAHGGLPPFHSEGGPQSGSHGKPKPPIPPKHKFDAGPPKGGDAF